MYCPYTPHWPGHWVGTVIGFIWCEIYGHIIYIWMYKKFEIVPIFYIASYCFIRVK